jgi:flagellin-like protein
MNKRGISEVISLVLLIGMAVALAILVTNWTRNQVEESTGTIVNSIEKDEKCALAAMNVNYEENSCSDQILTGYLKLLIMNRGDVKLVDYGIKLNTEDVDISNVNFDEDITIMPFETKTLKVGIIDDNLEEITIIPYVEIEGNKIGCFEKRIVLKCE